LKKENKIVPVNSNLSVKKVKRLITLTDKLLRTSDRKDLVLFNTGFHNEQNVIEASIINFISTHFWYFIADIKQITLENNLESKVFNTSLYERVITENRKPIEFPYVEHRLRGGGGYGYGIEGWGKMSKSEKEKYHNLTSLIDEELRRTILSNLTPRIVGNICYKLANTSVGKILGIKIKTAGNNVYSA
jgi:hypothetical protein